MRFAIDVAFFVYEYDAWNIVHVRSYVKPWNPYVGRFGAQACLECAAGTIDAYDLRIHDRFLLLEPPPPAP